MNLMGAIYDGDDHDDEITVRRGDVIDLDLERDRYRARVEQLETAVSRLLEGEFRSHHHEGWVEFTERRVAELRTAVQQ